MIIAALSQFIKQLVLKFALWCIGGDHYLSPTNSVIIVTFICVLTRKGSVLISLLQSINLIPIHRLLYFIGAFLSIRLLRILFSSVTDDKAARGPGQLSFT